MNLQQFAVAARVRGEFDVFAGGGAFVVAAYFPGYQVPSPTWFYPSPWGESDGTAYSANNVHMARYKGRIPINWPTSGAGDITVNPVDPTTNTLGNEATQTIIDQHLAWADRGGIGAFSVNWYQDDFASYACDLMASSTSTAVCKFFVQWSNHFSAMNAATSTRAFFFEGIRRASLRMGAARYWRRNGKPVLAIFSVTQMDDVIRKNLGYTTQGAYTPSAADRQNLLACIHNIAANVIHGDTTGGIVSGDTTVGSTTVVALASGAATTCHLVIMDSAWSTYAGVDATCEYNVTQGLFDGAFRNPHSYAEMRVAVQQSWVTGTSRALSGGGSKHWVHASPGWDHLPWGPSGDPLYDNCLPTVSERRQHFVDARNYAAAHAADSDGIIFLPWNELGEGTWVIPTPDIGFEGLDACALMSASGLQSDVEVNPRMSVSGGRIMDENGQPWCMRGFVYGEVGLYHNGDATEDVALGANCVRIMLRTWGGSVSTGNSYSFPNVDGEDSGAQGNTDAAYLAGVGEQLICAKRAGLKTILALDSNCGQNGNQDASMTTFCTIGFSAGQNYYTAGGATKRAEHLERARFVSAEWKGLIDFIEFVVEPNPVATGGTRTDINQMAHDCMMVAIAEDPLLIPILGGTAYQHGHIQDPIGTIAYPTTSIVLTCDLLDNIMTGDPVAYAAAVQQMVDARTVQGLAVICQQAGTKMSSEAGAVGSSTDSLLLASGLALLRDPAGDGSEDSIGWTFWEKVSKGGNAYGPWYDSSSDGRNRILVSQNRLNVLTAALNAPPIFTP